jgi:hypothetical protein
MLGRPGELTLPMAVNISVRSIIATGARTLCVDEQNDRHDVSIAEKAPLNEAFTGGPYKPPFLLKREAVIPKQYSESGD